MDKQIQIPRILYVLVMLSLTFQLFNTIPIFDRHYLFWLIAAVLSFSYCKDFLKSITFTWLVVYFLVICLNRVSGDSYFKEPAKMINELVAFFIPASMAFYLFKRKDKTLVRYLLLFFGVFLVESAIVSFYVNSLFPDIIRIQSSAENVAENLTFLQPFIRMGMTDYILPHAMPVIIPGLVYVTVSSKGSKRLIYALILVAAWMLSYVSGSFTALLLSTITLFLSFLVSKKNKRKTITRLVVASIFLVPLASSPSLQFSILDGVQQLIPDENIAYRKIADIEESIIYGDAEGGVGKRQEKYDQTFSVIQESPLIGTNEAKIGGHSAVLDRIAVLGLIGIIPYFLFIFYQLKYIIRYIGGAQRYYFYIGLFAALLMILSKNMSYWPLWFMLFTLLPGLLWIKDGEWAESKLLP